MYLQDNRIVTSKYISEVENISHGVVLRILKILRENNIVKSHQGRGQNVGGFTLKAKMENITMYNILTIMEGKIELTFPREDWYIKKYGNKCGINQELYRINTNLIQDLQKKSLYEIFVGKKKETSTEGKESEKNHFRCHNKVKEYAPL